MGYFGISSVVSNCSFATGMMSPIEPMLFLLGTLAILHKGPLELRFRQLSDFPTASEIRCLLPCPVLIKISFYAISTYSPLSFLQPGKKHSNETRVP